MEFAVVPDNPAQAEETPQLLKFYKVYVEYYQKFGRLWARKLGQFDKRRHDPFSRVNREVNTALRRYLGADAYARHIDTLEYMILRDGLLVKDRHTNTLDIPERTFNEWAL